MIERLKSWFRADPAQPATLAEELAAGAARFAGTLAEADAALAAEKDPSEQRLSDAAAFLGESFRAQFGGSWREDDLFGLVIAEIDGLPGARFVPLAVVEKKLRDRHWSIVQLFESLGERVLKERAAPAPAGTVMPTGTPPAFAAEGARLLVADWHARFSQPLALSLAGVRQLDGFLRTHYYFCRLDGAYFAAAGCFVGEVARGLFGGEWIAGAAPEDLALRYPELDYYPVGRVLKMMTERPDAEPLDEYIRLVPSARKELGLEGGSRRGA